MVLASYTTFEIVLPDSEYVLLFFGIIAILAAIKLLTWIWELIPTN